MLKKKWVKPLILISVLVPILLFNVWVGIRIHQLSCERALLKNDYSEVNDILHGLLSVTVWRDDLKRIANDRIQDFSFSPEQEEILKTEISKVLNAVITQS